MLLSLSGFVKRVGDHLSAPVLCISPQDSCRRAVEKMKAAGVTHALVTGSGGRILGILTERDVARRMAFEIDGTTPVSEVMSAPVRAIRDHEFLYLAIAKMRRLGLRHLPVLDESGKPAGVIELASALCAAAEQTVEQIDRLAHDETLEGMSETKASQIMLARELLEEAVPAPDILALISEINTDLHRRVIDVLLTKVRSEALGTPPVPFELILMGSAGRLESALHPDQDNGFILGPYADADHESVDAWFIEFAEQMVDALERLGFPRCRGHVMATNPVWRKRLQEWHDQTSLWLGKSSGLVLRLCDIFFDFRCAAGSGEMSAALRDHITRLAPQPFFLREMYKLDEIHGPALGLFGRLKTDPMEGPGQGRVNLKLTGTLPLVGLVRIFSLREGIAENSTLERIRVLHERGVLNDDEADYLRGGFQHVTRMVLRQQIADFDAGMPLGNHVPLESMTRRDRDMLVDAFQALKRLRSRLRLELGVEPL